LRWQVNSDTFHFPVKLGDDVAVTHRNMLRMVSSLFDPLGLIAPVIVVGRILFQDAMRLDLSWDDPVPVEVLGAWNKWLESLQDLNQVVVSRCSIPEGFEDAYMELHHFSDASSRAYGCCSYLRCLDKSGKIHSVLLYGKGRVAPMKALSIPRLELQAAVLAARVDSMLREQLCVYFLGG
jgi:hypothetical protein